MKKVIVFFIFVTASLFSANLISNSLIADGLKEYYLYCDKGEFDNINQNPKENTYIAVTVKYDGQEWTDAKMRIRGDGSRDYPKKSFKVKFNDKKFANDSKSLNLNAEWTDPTYFRQYISTYIFNQSGQYTYDTELVAVYLNDDFLGLFLAVQNMDDDALKEMGLKTSGNLYKATVDGASLSIDDRVKESWEKKTNSSESWEDLYTLIDSLYYTSDADYYDFCHRTFDYSDMINFLAMNMMLINKSTYTHNYYMYHDVKGDGKWKMLPWDTDKSIGYAPIHYPIDLSSSDWFNDNPILERGLLDQRVRADIEKRCEEINTNYFDKTKIKYIYDSLASLIEQYVAIDKTDDIESVEKWKESYNKDLDHFVNRYKEVDKQFKNKPKFFKVEKIREYVIGDKRVVSWSPSESQTSDELTYIFSYGPKPYYDIEGSVVTEDIKDTFFVMENLKPNQKYYYFVYAKARYFTEAWDTFNYFWTKERNELPCTISSDMTLKASDSPYIVSCKVKVDKNVNLTIEAGVEIWFEKNGWLTVEGSIEAIGKPDSKILFRQYDKDNISFSKLELISNHKKAVLKHCEFDEIILHSHGHNIDMDYVNFNIDKLNLNTWDGTNNLSLSTAYLIYGDYNIKNCRFEGNQTGEGLMCRFGTAEIENCEFTKMLDPLEFVEMKDSKILNCRFYDNKDDAIDLNQSSNVLIKNNQIYNIEDKGISIGNSGDETANVQIVGNIIYNAKIAVAVKENVIAQVENCDIMESDFGIMSYEKNAGDGGGNIKAVNNILFNNKKDIFKDDKSELEISYSLSNKTEMAGSNNIKADPLFEDFANMNFYLQAGSPCIDAGDPSMPKDKDGTNSDIGVYAFNQGSFNIVINEINYNSSPDFQSEDWIELYNAEKFDVSLAGWQFKDSKDDNFYIFSDNQTIKAEDFLIVSRNSVAFSSLFPNVTKISEGDFTFGLGSGGDAVRIFNRQGVMIDSVEYDDKMPWAEMPDGNGPTLELKSPSLDNSLAINWEASENNGSPGKSNSQSSNNDRKFVIDLATYPNPYVNHFDISFNIEDSLNYKLEISDNKGRIVLRYDDIKFGKNTLRIDNILHSGVYYIHLINENNNSVVGKAKVIKMN